MQIKTKKLKGFTLIELIVVLAIFSMVMFGALALILPVSNQFRSTVRFENVRANLDNIRLYIEGSLRYADRVHVYTGANGMNVDDAVKKFSNAYKFNVDYIVASGEVEEKFNRAAVDASINDLKIYALEIHNSDKGRISLRTYDSAGDLKTIKDYAVNKAFYENYHYKVNFGEIIDKNGDGVIDDNDRVNKEGDPDPNGFFKYEKFSPGDFAVTVEVEEKQKDGTFAKTNFTSTATFALMNVWDGGGVKRDLFYSKNITQSDDLTGEVKYNFKWLNPETNQIENKVPDYAGHSELRYKSYHNGVGDDIVIIFTIPKQIEATP